MSSWHRPELVIVTSVDLLHRLLAGRCQPDHLHADPVLLVRNFNALQKAEIDKTGMCAAIALYVLR